jgi:hypothetical protein
MGALGEGTGRVKERVEPIKVTYIHSCDKSRNPLNTDFGIKNERQDYKIGTVGEGYL